jgi:hypothetical protein
MREENLTEHEKKNKKRHAQINEDSPLCSQIGLSPIRFYAW